MRDREIGIERGRYSVWFPGHSFRHHRTNIPPAEIRTIIEYYIVAKLWKLLNKWARECTNDEKMHFKKLSKNGGIVVVVCSIFSQTKCKDINDRTVNVSTEKTRRYVLMFCNIMKKLY